MRGPLQFRFFRRLAVLSLLVGAGLPSAVVRADEDAVPAPMPEESNSQVQEVVQAVEDTYRDVQTLQAHFEQTVTAAGQVRTDQGEVLLSRPRKMRWDFAGPNGSLFVTDGTYMWVYTRHLKQAIRYQDLGQAASSIAPIELQDLESLREKFIVGLAPEGARKSNLVLVLTPKEVGKYPFKEVKLELTSKYVIDSLRVTDTLDNLTVLQFTKVKLNPDVSDASFHFEPPADVEVIEAGGF